jgi:hypothetical protein
VSASVLPISFSAPKFQCLTSPINSVCKVYPLKLPSKILLSGWFFCSCISSFSYISKLSQRKLLYHFSCITVNTNTFAFPTNSQAQIALITVTTCQLMTNALLIRRSWKHTNCHESWLVNKPCLKISKAYLFQNSKRNLTHY